MKKSLLTDFGASRIKAAILINGEIKDVREYPSVKPCNLTNKSFEVSCADIKDKFMEIAKVFHDLYDYDNIFICSEMHGFMVVDANNHPLSNYISWKSERSTVGTPSNFDILSSKTEKFFHKITGMNLRACYPIFNLYDMMEKNEITGGKLISLPDWLACAGGHSLNKSHVTMAAGFGFYNIYKNEWDKDLINKMKYPVTFNKVVKNVEIGGYITLNERKIPVYTGVGDHQCAILGADNSDKTISVNLGTGSQIGIINLDNPYCEKRPYFNGDMLSVITHIPSGRMLNCFIHFLETINPDVNFWEELGKITVKDIENADLDIDLGIFKSAWNYQNGGAVSKINESNFTKTNYLASLLKNYIMQYKNAIENLKPPDKYNQIILSGGIPSKLPIVKEYLDSIINSKEKKYAVSYKVKTYDETLEGLKIIASEIKPEN